MNNVRGRLAARGALYTLGMSLLALGLTLNTKAAIGVSPLISVAYSASVIWELDLGNAIFVWYCVFVMTEVLLCAIADGAVRGGRFIVNILQLPLSLVFTRLMNLLSGLIPEFGIDCVFGESLWQRVLILAAAVVITGIGAGLSLNMRILPNPGDGVVQCLSDCTGWKLGLTKNVFDVSCVLLTVALSLLAAGRIVGLGLGTIIAMLGTGRVIAVFNRLFEAKIRALVRG